MDKRLMMAALLATVFSAEPASAQSFLKRAGAAAQSLLSKAPKPEAMVERAAGDVIGAATAPKAKRSAPDAADRPTPKPGPAPRATKARLPSAIKPSSEIAERKRRFVEFSRYSCNDCEGGRGYDAWARQILNLTANRAWEMKVGALGLGEAIEWQGRESDGVLVVESENPVDGLRCKQVKWTLRHRSDRRIAEREGLFCFGKPDRYVDIESWVEVY